MYAQHSVPPHSAALRPQQALVAIVYANEAYPQSTFERIVEDCRRRGLRVAGVLQHPVCSEAAGHCDVALEELTTGLRTDLFEDRGPGAHDVEREQRHQRALAHRAPGRRTKRYRGVE